MPLEINLFNIGFLLFLIGFIIVFIAIVLFIFESFKISKKVKGGGILFIGPIPIGFATDKETLKWLIVLSIIAFVFIILIISVI